MCRDKPSLSTKVDISNLNFDVKCLNLTAAHSHTDAHSHTADSQARWESDNDRVQRRPLYPAFFSTIFKIGELPYLFSILIFQLLLLSVYLTSIFAQYLFSIFIFQGERSTHVAWLTDNDTEVQCFCIFLQFVWNIRILMKK